tara:strand:+ start:527 stop:772 length:246 start_codon:yes stop_codon:yes gene_type:complete
MSLNKEYSVTVVPDREAEPFSTSLCNCDICRSMHNAQIEWDSFQPKTRLQSRMKDVVSKIEADILAGKHGNISKFPEYLRH